MTTTNTAPDTYKPSPVAHAARVEFCAAALAVAQRRNVLTVAERADLAQYVADGVADASGAVDADSEGYMLADQVLWDMSLRCRSFTPPELANLIRINRIAWDAD